MPKQTSSSQKVQKKGAAKGATKSAPKKTAGSAKESSAKKILTVTKSAKEQAIPVTAGKKKKNASKDTLSEKCQKEHSLMTKDISFIVSEVVKALLQSDTVTPSPPQTEERITRSSRRTSDGALEHNRRSSSNREGSPSRELEESSDDDDAGNEDFGECNCMQHSNTVRGECHNSSCFCIMPPISSPRDYVAI